MDISLLCSRLRIHNFRLPRSSWCLVRKLTSHVKGDLAIVRFVPEPDMYTRGLPINSGHHIDLLITLQQVLLVDAN
jgi:hypothetical protein